MNLICELVEKFGSENVLVNRLDSIVKICNTDILTVIDFVRPFYDDIIEMIVNEEDKIVLYCVSGSEFRN